MILAIGGIILYKRKSNNDNSSWNTANINNNFNVYSNDYNRALGTYTNPNQFEQQVSKYPYNTTTNDTAAFDNYQQNNYSYQQGYNYQNDYNYYDYNQQNYKINNNEQKEDKQSIDTSNQIYVSYQQKQDNQTKGNNSDNNDQASSSDPNNTDPGKVRFRDKYKNRVNGEENGQKPLSRYASYRNQLMS